MGKHNLVSAILRRWKYCLDSWPGEIKVQPPQGFIEAHVCGLYVGVANSVLGQLKDLRPYEDGKTPSMASLLSKKAIDLRDLLIKGIQNQLSVLTDTLQDQKLKEHLRRELQKAEKLKVKKIERKYQEALSVSKEIEGNQNKN